jgi:hypothetical protein
MSHTGAWWIFRFQPYKPNRSLTTSMLRCSKRQIGFSFVFDWNRASGNMKHSTFFSHWKTLILAHVAHRCGTSVSRLRLIFSGKDEPCHP